MAAILTLRDKSIICLVESLNADNASSNRLRVFHLHDNDLYTAAVKKLSNLIRVAAIS